MDKNTIIGFLLIGVVLIVFTWLNQPTPEQIEAQRRMQDSIARIEYAKQLEQQKAKRTKKTQQVENQLSLFDFVA
jgi:YidC/Oxa1 family membrane protein insertase